MNEKGIKECTDGRGVKGKEYHCCPKGPGSGSGGGGRPGGRKFLISFSF